MRRYELQQSLIVAISTRVDSEWKPERDFIMARKEIKAGQRFRCLKPLRSDWTVVQVYGKRPDTSHAIMAKLGDTTTTKTLACTVLLNPQRYQPLSLDHSED